MDSSTGICWPCPFVILGALHRSILSLLFNFHGLMMWRLIWVCTVYLSPFYGFSDNNALNLCNKCFQFNKFHQSFHCSKKLGRVAQSVGRLTRKSGVLGSIPGLILSFLLPPFQEGQLSVSGESMCTKLWLTA